MKRKDCLNDQDLILHYYGEESADKVQKQHLESCSLCAERLAALAEDLGHLPELDYAQDDLAGIRLAAKVAERIRQPRRSKWLPALGVASAAALVLVISLTGLPQPEVNQVVHLQTQQVITMELDDDMPDIDFLEDLELLRDLELLAQIEGV